MKIVYTCARCATVFPPDVVEKWGTQKETTGYGPTARCVELVDRPGTPPGSLEVCGGQLIAASVANDTPERKLTPLGGK